MRFQKLGTLAKRLPTSDRAYPAHNKVVERNVANAPSLTTDVG